MQAVLLNFGAAVVAAGTKHKTEGAVLLKSDTAGTCSLSACRLLLRRRNVVVVIGVQYRDVGDKYQV